LIRNHTNSYKRLTLPDGTLVMMPALCKQEYFPVWGTMTERLDVVTRTYEYQRAQPAFFGGTMSGLETAQLALDGKLPTPPIVATLGISLVEVAEGHAALEGSPAEWQCNQLGTVHGGWLSALLDSALGYAVHTVLPSGHGFTTLDLHVRFLRAVPVTSGGVYYRQTVGGNRPGQNILTVPIDQIELKPGFPDQLSCELFEFLWTSRFIGVCRLVRDSGSERCNDVRRWKQSSAEHAASQKDGEQRQNGQPKPEEHLDK
jgi:uncharacterized protein (TIGR00369 family)